MSKPVSAAESLSLTVTLAGRPYPLRVLPTDEEPIRRIAKELNDKIVDFQRAYSGKDKQDCLAMLLLLYAVDLYKAKVGQPDPDGQVAPTLQTLERDLRRALAATGSGVNHAGIGEDGSGADDSDAGLGDAGPDEDSGDADPSHGRGLPSDADLTGDDDDDDADADEVTSDIFPL